MRLDMEGFGSGSSRREFLAGLGALGAGLTVDQLSI